MGSADHGFGDGINLFGVEQQIVLLEQPRHAGAMQRQLERAEAERAEDYLAVLGQTAIVLPHTFDARRRRGVCIGYQFQRGAVLPLFFVQQSNAGGACPEHYLRPLDGRAALDMGGRFYGLYHHSVARVDPIADCLHDLALAAGDGHIRALPGQQDRGALTDLDAVADLYRSSHVGLALQLTPHPSYQPLEFAACGVATVANRNPHTEWLLRDGETALLADALPSAIAEALARLVEDAGLRERLAATAREQVLAVRWEDEVERIHGAMTKRGEAFT